MNFKTSIELAGRNLVNMLVPEDHYLPYYDVIIDEDFHAFAMLWCPNHNIGRWWDAMLRLEDATGFKIPDEIEAVMMENVQAFFDNPDHLLLFPMDDERYDTEISRWLFDMHTPREALLTLDAFIRLRDSDWAREKAHDMVRVLYGISHPNTDPWDFDKLDRPRHLEECHGANNSADTMTSGRLVEALCVYYRTTGDDVALEFAGRLADVQVEYSCTPEGERNMWFTPNHCHSYLGMLRGLLLFGEITGRSEYIEVVHKTYDVTVRKFVRESGYICHDFDKETAGDPASAADAAEIALGLVRNGYPGYMDDVARIIRSRLLPCQITDCPPLKKKEVEVMADGKTARYINCVGRAHWEVPLKGVRFPANLHELVVGAYGGIHAEPHGRKYSTVDVSAAVLHSMCKFYKLIATRTGNTRTILFHFDYEDDNVRIVTERDRNARVRITCREKEEVRIRVPGWVPVGSISLTVDGESIPAEVDDGFVRVQEDLLPGEIALTYALPRRKTVETTDGTDWEFTWRGDEITAISPNASVLPFYPDA